MATYGVYSKDLKGCYISGLDMIDARRYLSGRGDRVLCLEREVVSELKIKITLRKYWYWRLRPQFGYLEMGFISVDWHTQKTTEPYKVVYAYNGGEINAPSFEVIKNENRETED